MKFVPAEERIDPQPYNIQVGERFLIQRTVGELVEHYLVNVVGLKDGLYLCAFDSAVEEKP